MKKRRKIDIEYIQKFLLEVSPNTKLISTNYNNARQSLNFICECGKNFTKNFYTIDSQQKCLCNSCSKKDGWKNIRKEISIESLKKEVESFGFKIINEEKYYLNKEKIKVIDSFGYIGKISLENIRKGKHFSVFSVVFNEENLLYNLNNFILINNYDVKVLSYWKENKTIKLKCKCCCGNEYITNVGDFTTQNRVFCKECTKNQSTLERIIKNELKLNNIVFIEQKRFDNCRGTITNYTLPFDFYLKEYNTIIEVDGQQHFEPTRIKGVTKEEAEQIFKRTIYNDKIKNKYCYDNDIKMIRISYKEIKNKEYKQIIQSIIN